MRSKKRGSMKKINKEGIDEHGRRENADDMRDLIDGRKPTGGI